LSKIKITARLPEHGHGAARQRIGDVAPAIGQIARIGQEEIARPDLAAVVGNAGRHDAQRFQAVEEFARRAHSLPFPEPASATWIGASGGTPRVRRHRRRSARRPGRRRRRHSAAGRRLVDHHRDDQARIADRRDTDKGGDVFLGVDATFDLVGGAGLAADAVARHARLGAVPSGWTAISSMARTRVPFAARRHARHAAGLRRSWSATAASIRRHGQTPYRRAPSASG
jgi:hypothetical protein